jgi:predicted Zn finger-like uncharacterized protein
MHTRCPECQTTFNVKQSQLDARDGVVRCGRCSTIFRAKDYRVDRTPTTGTARKPGKSEAGAPSVKPRRKPATAARAVTPPAANAPVQLQLPVAVRGPRTRLPFLIAGNALLLLLLLTQTVYFYGGDLAAMHPRLKPSLASVCQVLGCRLTPPQDINLIDLVEARVAPHPKFDKALRIRATLVNRAAFYQAFPAMEVTLSDNSGQVIARRAFRPQEYLEQSGLLEQGMPPNLAESVLLDVTRPNTRAVGYEIRLLTTN